MRRSSGGWFEVANAAEIASPALLVYAERVEENLRQMLDTVASPDRLRPHIKTHKMPELMKRQLAHGITRFKCATIAEAEMAATSGAPDILLAYQLVGANVARWIKLLQRYPQTRFSTIVDDPGAARALADAAAAAGEVIELLLDLDVGQHRTGIVPGRKAFELYRWIASQPSLAAGGLHAYDGHIHDRDPVARQSACDAAFVPVAKLREELLRANLPVPRVVAGGTPTFPFHAKRSDIECSPGTCLLWDASYQYKLSDTRFIPAALLLTRVVSKPTSSRICLDLGHKAVGSEMPHPRVELLELPDANFVVHSEEHLVVETAHAADFEVGDVLYGLPWHICPTVALHAEAHVVENGRAVGQWSVTARDRRLTV